MAARPAVLLVHGAWHGGWCWAPLIPELAAVGLTASTVDLPSAGGDGDLAADAAVVRAALDDLPGPVVVVGHSYGGQVISEATAGRDDVAALVYLCAFLLEPGTSLVDALAGDLPPWLVLSADGATSTVSDPVHVFSLDLDPADAQASSARLVTQTVSSFAQPLTGAGWQQIPSTYVVCTQDQAIPAAAQQAMSAAAGSVHTLVSSHSPFASHPAEVAAIIAGALAG